MTEIDITDEFLDKVKYLIEQQDDEELLVHFKDLHHADIAEVFDQLNIEEVTYIVKLLDSNKTAEVLMELDQDDRQKILDNLNAREIADEIREMDTDDATDIIGELPDHVMTGVVNNLQGTEMGRHIQELLKYDENSAGGLMAKELIKVNENWNVTGCLTEMRAQAENVTRVHSIYVVDDDAVLKGRLSLKDLITAPKDAQINDIYIKKVDFVDVHTPGEEVARIMQKYDLEAIPVVDELKRLVGRITIDDIVDFITEEADKDYQLAAGISEDVAPNDNVGQFIRARLPWLILGLIGGLGAVYILQGFEGALAKYPLLFFFTPLIAAMAGNVGVQSSAIAVQGLTKGTFGKSIFKLLAKEVLIALLNGLALGLLILAFGYIMGIPNRVGLTISLSVICVIMVAAIIGTSIPIILDRRGVDPAIATGPFITTSNDIFGIFIFFFIAKMILGF